MGVAPSIGILLAEEVTSSQAWAGLARTASTLGAALLGLPLGNPAALRTSGRLELGLVAGSCRCPTFGARSSISLGDPAFCRTALIALALPVACRHDLLPPT